MPLPLIPIILGGASLAAAALGIKKGVDAKSDFDTAEHWNKKAQRLYDEASNELESAHNDAQQTMKFLGESKFKIYENSIIPFVECFSKIKNIDFDDSRLLDASNLPKITTNELSELRQAALEMKEVVGGGIAALGSGGLAGLAGWRFSCCGWSWYGRRNSRPWRYSRRPCPSCRRNDVSLKS